MKCYLESLWLQALSESQSPMYGVSPNNWVKRVEIATLKTHIWLMSPAFPCSTGGNTGINEYLLTVSASVSWKPSIFFWPVAPPVRKGSLDEASERESL